MPFANADGIMSDKLEIHTSVNHIQKIVMAMSIHNAHNGEPSVITVGNPVCSFKQINAAKRHTRMKVFKRF